MNIAIFSLSVLVFRIAYIMRQRYLVELENNLEQAKTQHDDNY